MIKGHIDRLDTSHAYGWCYDPENPEIRFEVVVTCNGAEVARSKADVFRQDLCKMDEKGDFAFFIHFPAVINLNAVKVLVYDTNGRSFQLYNNSIGISKADQKGDSWSSIMTNRIVLDYIDDRHIGGWFRIYSDNNQTLDPILSNININLYIDSHFYHTQPYLYVRDDIIAHGCTSYAYMFVVDNINIPLIRSKIKISLIYNSQSYEAEIYTPVSCAQELESMSNVQIMHTLNYLTIDTIQKFKITSYKRAQTYQINDLENLFIYLKTFDIIYLSEDRLVNILKYSRLNQYIKFSLLYSYLKKYDTENILDSRTSLPSSIKHMLLESITQKYLSKIKDLDISESFINYSLSANNDFLFALMQKNDGYLLLFWILYYIQLAGYKRICLFDNGSTDTETLRILNIAENLGIKVIYNYNKTIDFLNKGEILSKNIEQFYGRKLNIIPLDVDEFIYAINPKITFDPKTVLENISHAISKFSIDKSIGRIDKGFYNIPGRYDVTLFNCKRCILHSSFSDFLDMGLHLYDFQLKQELHQNKEIKLENLGYIHFHYRPYDQMRHASEMKLAPRVNINDTDALAKYNGSGRHLKTNILQGRREYETKLQSFIINSVDNISREWQACKLPYPFLEYDFLRSCE